MTTSAKVLLDRASSLVGDGGCVDCFSLVAVALSGIRNVFKGGLP